MEITPLNQWTNCLGKLIIAGPCSAETEQQMLDTARKIQQIGSVHVFRAGLWKPRTRPDSFEGVGIKGLAWLKQVKQQTGLMTAIEVANARHVELALKNDVDILWIGARSTTNPFSVQEIADCLKGCSDVSVMVKNPINADLTLWIGAIERVLNSGIKKISAIHRGFSIAAKSKYRNIPLWKMPLVLNHNFPQLPIITYQNHLLGKSVMLVDLSQRALVIDKDVFMIECYIYSDVDSCHAIQ